MHDTSTPESEPPTETGSAGASAVGLRIRFRSLFRLMVVSASFGLLAAFHVPIQLIFLISAGVGVICLIIKFIRDNLSLGRRMGAKRLVKAMGTATVCFLPFVLVLLPGYWVGGQVNYWTNRGIERLQILSAPEIISKEVQNTIEKRIEERVKRDLPWWYEPAVWVGAVDDYATQVRVEMQSVVETVNETVPKPATIRAAVGFLKAALLAVGVYSFAWVVVLFLRAYASLFGRVLVAMKPPVVFGEHGPSKQRKARRKRRIHEPLLESGPKIDLVLEPGEQLFVRRSDLPGNAVPDWHLRAASGSALMRLRRGLFSVDRVRSTTESQVKTFRAPGGFQYVHVVLGEDQEVVVNPARLIGFSDSVLFHTRWNFNLAMLALHHAASHVARGPGRLVFKCSGEPGTFASAREASAMHMGNLILYGRDARFAIEASGGFHNYLASGCLVRPVSGDLFVCAPEKPAKVSIMRAIWILVKQAYLPI